MQLAAVDIKNPENFFLRVQGPQKKSCLPKKRSDYYAFGLTMPGRSSNTGNPNDNYKFTGHERDDEAGLTVYHMNARGMDPVLGRMMQIDPLADMFPGISTYAYGMNNPMKFTDPTGMAPVDFQRLYDDAPDGYSSYSVNDEGSIVNTTPSNQEAGGGCDPPGTCPEKQEKNPNDLNPSTLNQNLFGMHYPGGNNPQTYAGDPDFSTMPVDLGGFPAIGHDRRYGNLGTAGLKGLLLDTRAVGADWKFVGEELSIASFSYSTQNYGTALKSGALGVGLGLLALPKTIVTYSNPVFSQSYVSLWYAISNVGVTNAPSK